MNGCLRDRLLIRFGVCLAAAAASAAAAVAAFVYVLLQIPFNVMEQCTKASVKMS